MLRTNPHYARMGKSYLFAEIAHRVAAFRKAHPGTGVISMGIGDVTQPLVPSVIRALHAAVDDMGSPDAFHGYGPEQGYAFLREAVALEYAARGVSISPDDIFISDGAKCDLGNFQELFAPDVSIAVTDPVYPVYVDSNCMAGRGGTWTEHGWSGIRYLPCTAENGFAPVPPEKAPDVIYLCSPNNPTGTALDRASLGEWVRYARSSGMLIMFDSAYECFIDDTEGDIPHSIYEIPGADEVAVEFRSFSKSAGFTGLRCAYAVVPANLKAGGKGRLHDMWARRQTTKYNGCPYLVQKAAEAACSPEGRGETAAVVNIYRNNAALMRGTLNALGLTVYGGIHAPYLWVRTPRGMDSWDFFQFLLDRAAVVCTPGSGFGPSGEGYARLTAFSSPADTREAMTRLTDALKQA